MGMLGEMFPGAKALDEGGEDSDGKLHRPRFDIDLDSGVVRLPGLAARPPVTEQQVTEQQVAEQQVAEQQVAEQPDAEQPDARPVGQPAAPADES